MKIKQLLGTIFLTILFIPATFYGQSIDEKAVAGAEFICDCSKKALSKNGVDTVKLEEVFNSYQSNGFLMGKYRADVERINNQLNGAYSELETDIYKCRAAFRQRFSNNLGNREFLSNMQVIISKNAFTSGPQLIKELSN